MSGKFYDKMAILKQTIAEKSRNNQNIEQNIPHNHSCSNIQIKVNDSQAKVSRNELCIQQPIIIQKREAVSKPSSARKDSSYSYKEEQRINANTSKNRTMLPKKQIQPFKPIEIPMMEKRIDVNKFNDNIGASTNCNSKEIEIKIEKDDTKDKQCLKKLFKKIHKLTDQLTAAQKQNMQLKVELQNYKNVSKTCNNHEKIINKLEGEKYKLEVDINMLKKLMQEKDDQIKRLSSHVPKQIIKEVIIQKPVEIQIEVPKIVPGPERIVEKIVQVPKYIEIEKKVPVPANYQPPREIIKTIEVPTIVEKLVYIDKPVYIDRPIEIQKRVQIPIQMPPIEVPIYIDRPIVPEGYDMKIHQLQAEIEQLLRINDGLCRQNSQLKFSLQKVTTNLQILSRHNHEKNRETQLLMQNSYDYYPISPGIDLSSGSIRYSVSTNPHPRII